MEGAAEMENILQRISYQSPRVLKQLKLIRRMSKIPIGEELGGMWLSLRQLGSKADTFWSWCDDSVHSRLFACPPENPIFAHSVAVRLHQFGWGFGVGFFLPNLE